MHARCVSIRRVETGAAQGQFETHGELEASLGSKQKHPTIPTEDLLLLLFPFGRLPRNCQSQHQGGGSSPKVERVLDLVAYLSDPSVPGPRCRCGIHTEPIRDPAGMSHPSVWKASTT